MKLINSSYEILPQTPGIEGLYEQIEKAARVCYKSEDKIAEGTAKKMVDVLIKSGHYSMLEHGTVYLRVSKDNKLGYNRTYNKIKKKYNNNSYSKCVELFHVLGLVDHLFITTNYRVLVENGWLDDLQYLCEPTEYHEKRVTVKFICDRDVSHELVRHRTMSFAQESQRYCNYSKNKYSNEITFVIPSWCEDLNPRNTYDWELVSAYNLKQTESLSEDSTRFIMSCCYAEAQYLMLVGKGWRPQQARAVLPNATKTEILVTGFVSDWRHLFDLRVDGTTGAPHPDMKALMAPVKEKFKELELL